MADEHSLHFPWLHAKAAKLDLMVETAEKLDIATR
jgi:hypothetical protein